MQSQVNMNLERVFLKLQLEKLIIEAYKKKKINDIFF